MYDVTLKNRVKGINWSTAAWHNNHHAHPTAAGHGIAWYEIESTGGEIRVSVFWHDGRPWAQTSNGKTVQ